MQSQDSGKHLHDVLDLLQKHTLVEADISAQAERIKAVQGAANRFTSYEQGETHSLYRIFLFSLTYSICAKYLSLKNVCLF